MRPSENSPWRGNQINVSFQFRFLFNLKPFQVEVSARRVKRGGKGHLWSSHNYSNRSQKTCFYNKHLSPIPQKTHFLSPMAILEKDGPEMGQTYVLLNWFHLVEIMMEEWFCRIEKRWLNPLLTRLVDSLENPSRNCNIAQIPSINFSLRILLKYLAIFKRQKSLRIIKNWAQGSEE